MSKYKNHLVVIIFFLFILIIDLYCYWGLSVFNFQESLIFRSLYWLIPVFFILTFASIFLFKPKNISPDGFKKVMLFFASFLLFYLPMIFLIPFVILSDLLHLIEFIAGAGNAWDTANKIIMLAGLGLAGFMFLAVLNGILWQRFNFKIKRHVITSGKLPQAFDGLKIVQISDLHIGSFIGNLKHVQRGIDMINKEDPDIILFTGDLITVHADEVIRFFPILKQLKAKYGMYSVTGNHSYSGKDYFHWNKVDSPEDNLKKIIEHHKEIGFDILMNESRKLNIDGSFITLIGIENWGHPPFPQAGDIEKAYKDVDEGSFKILLSHDPSFFEAKVKEGYDIDLTLSGHTHAMQMGIKIGNFEWSPAKFKYPQWGGMYRENGKALYVNRGFGHVIYSARIGMPPEITVIELKTKELTK